MENIIKKAEILAPAGDLEKLKFAVLYGANAVFVGGKNFSLRAKASNFTIEDLSKGVEFCHAHNAKLYVTVNVYPHDEILGQLDEYLLDLDRINIDAIIVSSPYIVKRAKSLGCKFECHVSTQVSTNNSKAIKYFENMGVERVVLGREVTIEEMKEIKKNTNVELEVFIHGGLCSSYSGRCTLSNHMTNRDANRGGCAHSCRWFYHLFKGNEQIDTENSIYRIGSKDLMGVYMIPKLLELGIESLKIEGRMKSIHYIATVTSVYRKIVDTYYDNPTLITEDFLNNCVVEIQKAENRPTCVAWLKGEVTKEDMIYSSEDKTALQEFAALVLDYDKDNNIAKIYRKNYFKVGDILEVFSTEKYNGKTFNVEKLWDNKGNEIEIANRSDEILTMKVPFVLKVNDILRTKK